MQLCQEGAAFFQLLCRALSVLLLMYILWWCCSYSNKTTSPVCIPATCTTPGSSSGDRVKGATAEILNKRALSQTFQEITISGVRLLNGPKIATKCFLDGLVSYEAWLWVLVQILPWIQNWQSSPSSSCLLSHFHLKITTSLSIFRAFHITRLRRGGLSRGS